MVVDEDRNVGSRQRTVAVTAGNRGRRLPPAVSRADANKRRAKRVSTGRQVDKEEKAVRGSLGTIRVQGMNKPRACKKSRMV